MDTTEIILNLWYIADELGVIYSLRAHAYVGVGTECEKLEFLRSRADLDYLVATPFPLPGTFHTHFVGIDDEVSLTTEKTMPVVLASSLEPFGGPIQLFEEVFQEVESRLPSQTKLSVGKSPLVYLTPVIRNADGTLQPRYNGTGSLPGTAG